MNRFSRSMAAFATAGLVSLTGGKAQAALLYDSTTGTALSAKLDRPHIPPASADFIGQGDDFSTGFSSVDITGLTFDGSVGPSTNFVANFYDASGNFITSVTPAAGELTNTIGTQTFGSADFGPSGVVVPGNGYLIFSETSSDGVTRPSFNLEFEAGPATTGANSTALSAELNYQGVLTTGTYATGIGGVPANVAQFSLSGTSVPEPSIVGLLAAPLLMTLRRRRTANLSA